MSGKKAQRIASAFAAYQALSRAASPSKEHQRQAAKALLAATGSRTLAEAFGVAKHYREVEANKRAGRRSGCRGSKPVLAPTRKRLRAGPVRITSVVSGGLPASSRRH